VWILSSLCVCPRPSVHVWILSSLCVCPRPSVHVWILSSLCVCPRPKVHVWILSSLCVCPRPKVHVWILSSLCVCPCYHHLPLLAFNISVYFSQTTGPIGTKPGRNVTLVVLNILHNLS